MDPEQQIDRQTLSAIALALQDRKEIPPRLIYRAMLWAIEEMSARDRMIDAAVAVLTDEPVDD